jgi:signal transduction histidine kinase
MLPSTMSSLPIPSRMPLSIPTAQAVGLTTYPAACTAEDEQFLLRAFSSFAEAAGSLERSYGLLRAEVTGLRRQLEESNASLSQSLEKNRRMRQHLNRIVEGLPCGVLAMGKDGTFSLINPEGQRLLAACDHREEKEERSKQRPATSEVKFQSTSALPSELQQFLERARLGTIEQEQSFPAAAGRTRWLAVRHAAVPDDPECASIFILRDVSESKRLDEEREKLRRGQALAEMSAMLAHEIRNPLGSIELFAGLLGEIDLPEEQLLWVGHVQAGLRNLAATVNNVLHFHSLPPSQRAPTDLGQLLHWTQEFLSPLARQSRVEVQQRNSLHGVFLDADRHRLEQVLLNLSLNALRSMPGGGWLELSGRRLQVKSKEKEEAVIAVTDTGPGIAPENLQKIFEAGFSTRAGSPGLGLAVCRKIVEQHGGTIEAASRPGAGATFTLRFPLNESGSSR